MCDFDGCSGVAQVLLVMITGVIGRNTEMTQETTSHASARRYGTVTTQVTGDHYNAVHVTYFLARCMYVLHFATAHVPILTY